MDTVEINDCGNEKGRGLFLKKSFQIEDQSGKLVSRTFIKGSEEITDDTPIVCIQNHESKDLSLVCAICNRYMGNLALQWDLLTKRKSVKECVNFLFSHAKDEFPEIPEYDDQTLTTNAFVDCVLKDSDSLSEFATCCSLGCSKMQTVAYGLLKYDVSLFEKLVHFTDEEAGNRFLLMFALSVSTTVCSGLNLFLRYLMKLKHDSSTPKKTLTECLEVCWSHMDQLVKKPYWDVCRSVDGPVSRLTDLESSRTGSVTSSIKFRGRRMNENWETEMKNDAEKLRLLLKEMVSKVVSDFRASCCDSESKKAECCSGENHHHHHHHDHSDDKQEKSTNENCCCHGHSHDEEHDHHHHHDHDHHHHHDQEKEGVIGKIDAFDFSILRKHNLTEELQSWVDARLLKDMEQVAVWLGAFCLNTIDVRIGNPIVSYFITMKEGFEEVEKVAKSKKSDLKKKLKAKKTFDQLTGALEDLESGMQKIRADWERKRLEELDDGEEFSSDEEVENSNEDDFIKFDFSKYKNEASSSTEDEEEEESSKKRKKMSSEKKNKKKRGMMITSQMISSFHGYGLYPTVSALNHDCNPNALCTYRIDNLVVLEARRRINGGEELTISYVNVNDDLNERRNDLFGYGFVCKCNRCLKEETMGAADEEDWE